MSDPPRPVLARRAVQVAQRGAVRTADAQPAGRAQQLHRRRCTPSCAPRSTPPPPTARVRCVAASPAPAAASAPARISTTRHGRRAPTASPTSAPSIERYYKPLALRLQAMPVPVVCAVNGVAAGAGANFALLLRHRARRALGELHPGVLEDRPDPRLRRHLAAAAPGGPRAARWRWRCSATSSAAEDAERLGLIWKCVDDADLPARGRRAGRRAWPRMPTRALVATRQALDASQSLDARRRARPRGRVQGDARRRAHDFARRRRRVHGQARRRVQAIASMTTHATDAAAPSPSSVARPHVRRRPRVAGPRHAHRRHRRRHAHDSTMTVRDDMLNGHGICHGGFITTLADSAFAFACNSRNELTVAVGPRRRLPRAGAARRRAHGRRPSRSRKPAASASTTSSCTNQRDERVRRARARPLVHA